MKRILSLTLLSLVVCNTFGMDNDQDLQKQLNQKNIKPNSKQQNNVDTEEKELLTNRSASSSSDDEYLFKGVNFSNSDSDSDSDTFYSCDEYVDNGEHIYFYKQDFKRDKASSLARDLINIAKNRKQSKLQKTPDKVSEREVNYIPVGRYGNPRKEITHKNRFKIALINAPEEIKRKVRKLNFSKAPLRAKSKKMLFTGEAGDGKTTLGKAIAYATGRRYYYIPTPELLDSWQNCHKNVGFEIKRLIKNEEPLIVIFDEIDEVAKKDKNNNSSGSSSAKALWLWIDKCQEVAPYLVLVGTSNNDKDNFPYPISSRFKTFIIPRPNAKALQNALQINLSDFNHTITNDDIKELSEQLVGRSYRDIEAIVEDAYDIAPIKNNDCYITREHLDQAIIENPVKRPVREIAKEFVAKKWESKNERNQYIADNLQALKDDQEFIETCSRAEQLEISRKQCKMQEESLQIQQLGHIAQLLWGFNITSPYGPISLSTISEEQLRTFNPNNNNCLPRRTIEYLLRVNDYLKQNPRYNPAPIPVPPKKEEKKGFFSKMFGK